MPKRAARLELGSPTAVREEIRSYGWEHTLHTLLTDLHYAARQLIRNPGFALVTTLTLALGIGASTAIFSAVNPILFKPLPYPNAGRLMMIWEMRSDGSSQPVTFGTFYGLEQRARSFETMAVMKPWQPALTGALQPERFEGQRVSADYFRTSGYIACAGTRLQGRRRSIPGPQCSCPQRPDMAASLRSRSHHRWPAGQAGRQPFHRDRRHARGSRTSWLLQQSCGRRYSTTPRFPPTAETGVITCRWWAGCAAVSAAIKPGMNST